MCDPVSISYGALAIGSTLVAADQQNKMAAYQNELNEYNNQLSRQNMAENMNALAYNQNQEREAATEQLWRDDIEARRAEARARVAAGESGIAGQTVDSIMREIKGQQAMYASSINQNLQRGAGEADSQRRQIWNNYLSEVGSRPKAVGANGLATALSIGQAGLGAYNMHQDRQFRKEYLASRGPTK